MVSKRALAASQSSQSQSQPPPSSARPAKRPRVARSPPSSAAEPSTVTSDALVVPETPVLSSSAPSDPAPPRKAPRPPKRTRTEGSLRRLSSGHPSASHARTDTAFDGTKKRPRTRPTTTLAGAKVGGKAKDLRDRVQHEELWVRRSSGATQTGQGLGFAGYLKMGVGAFVERGCTSLTVNAMGAAIPLALSLAMAIRDAIPGGEPPALSADGSDDDMDDDDGEEGIVRLEVRTGSKTVADEITPKDEDEDLVYQSRIKSTVSVELSLSAPLKSALGAGPAPVGRGNNGSSRRGKRSGRG